MLKYYIKKLKILSFYRNFLLALQNNRIIPPKYIVWDCTRRCNFNCEHCGAKNKQYLKELNTTQVKSFINDTSNLGVEYFVATGGEPLLRKDIFEIFTYAKNLGLKTGIATNAFFINLDNAEFIAKNFNTIQISLDGTMEVHNKIRRNEESFDRAVKALSLLKKYKAGQITISSVITKSNIKILERLANLVINIKPDIWKIILLMPIGNAEDYKNLALDKTEIKNLFELIKKYKKRINIQLGENIGYLGKYDKQIKNEPTICPIGFLACCLGVDGNIRGCPEQPDVDYFIEGNILKQNFVDIWENGFKKYRNNELTDNAKCRICKYKEVCRGGCWVMKTKGINCAKDIYSL